MNIPSSRFALVALLLASAASAGAQAQPHSQAQTRSFRGTVTHVSDGDTVWVRPASGGRPQPVRLVGIDAPELCQAHGEQARQALSSRVLRENVLVRVEGRDDYDRLLARITLDGQDVGGWMVTQGQAWSYRWRREPGLYVQQQTLARQARRGLWAESAVEPRTFRRQHGPCFRETGPASR
jgi:micrococcal nuclease